MEDWLERYARALRGHLGPAKSAAVLDMSQAEVKSILDMARVVARGTERLNAPLSSYLAGQYVAARVESGASATDAAAEAERIAAELLDPEPG